MQNAAARVIYLKDTKTNEACKFDNEVLIELFLELIIYVNYTLFSFSNSR